MLCTDKIVMYQFILKKQKVNLIAYLHHSAYKDLEQYIKHNKRFIWKSTFI